jgi:6-phosphogluconolactonase (cycloisomerase 2 family)
LTQVGSPVPANTDPSEILIMPSGQFVYVTNPQVGVVSAFSFSDSDGTLQQITGSPFISGAGALGLALDASQQFLYVANPSASNLPPFASTIGNISGFSIDSSTGALSPVLGSPFTSAVASSSGPLAITVDPGGRFVYGFNSGTSTSVWCFIITPATGQLLEVKSSPFSEAAGGVFALIDPTGNFLYTGTATGVAGYTYNSSTGVPTVIAGSVFATGPPGKMVLVE